MGNCQGKSVILTPAFLSFFPFLFLFLSLFLSFPLSLFPSFSLSLFLSSLLSLFFLSFSLSLVPLFFLSFFLSLLPSFYLAFSSVSFSCFSSFLQHHSHTEETARTAYGGNEVRIEDGACVPFFVSHCVSFLLVVSFQMSTLQFDIAFVVWHRRMRGKMCHPLSRGSLASLGQGRAFMTRADAEVRAVDLLKRVYPDAQGFRGRSQEDIAMDVLSTEQDLIWVAGCGEGKTIALLLTAIMCAEKGKVVAVISPQRNVMLSLKAQLDTASVSSRIFGDMDVFPGDAFATHAPDFSVMFFSIEALANNKMAWAAIEALGRFDRLAMVFADEIHLHLSSPSFRSAFSRAGDLRARIGRTVRFFVCTATLALGAEPALMEQLLLVPSQTVVRRSGALLGHKFSFRVESLAGNECRRRLQEIIVEWADRFAHDTSVGRMAVLVTSVTKARQLQAEVTELLRARSSSDKPGLRVGSVTGEDTLETVTSAIDSCDLVFCTTFLCTATNMANLRHAIIFQTAFSLADVVQFLGRISREVDASAGAAVFLFDRHLHEQMFGLPSTRFAMQKDAEIVLACFSDDTSGVRLQLAPSYVARLVAHARTACVLEELNSVFVSQAGSSCKDLHNGRPHLFCDFCAGIAGADLQSHGAGKPREAHAQEGGGFDDISMVDYMDEEPDRSADTDCGRDSSDTAPRTAGGCVAAAFSGGRHKGNEECRDEEGSSGDELDEDMQSSISASVARMQSAPKDGSAVGMGAAATSASTGAQRMLSFGTEPAAPSRRGGSHGLVAAPSVTTATATAVAGGAAATAAGERMRADVTPVAAAKRKLPEDGEVLLDDMIAPRAGIPSDGLIASAGKGLPPKGPFLKLAETHMHAILDGYQRLAESAEKHGKIACLGCKDLQCNGYRVASKTLCPALTWKKGLICFKCGGPHSRCSRAWPKLLHRCNQCIMPWDETLGCTFHYGGAGCGKDGGKGGQTCSAIGDAIKSSLGRLWWSSSAEEWTAFLAAVKHHCAAPPPARPSEVDDFMLWLGAPAIWGNGMYNIDRAIEYVLLGQ